MATSKLSGEYGALQERLRVLILQHRSEEMDYDDDFLQEIQMISQKLLLLKQRMRTSTHSAFIMPVAERKSRRFTRYQ